MAPKAGNKAYLFIGFILVCALMFILRYRDIIGISIDDPTSTSSSMLDLPGAVKSISSTGSRVILERNINETTVATSVIESPPLELTIGGSIDGLEAGRTVNNQNENSELAFPPPLVPSIFNRSLLKIRSLSSVDYFSCCGLGHRLSKNADAYYVASKLLNFGLRVHWGFCDRIEVSHFLFGPQPLEQLQNVTSTETTVRLHNEVFGFRKLVRLGPQNNTACQCSSAKFESDVEYYTNLRQRFRFRNRVRRFKQKYDFANHTVIGMHIRAGNNETGDFAKKNRGIHNMEEWMESMVGHLKQLTVDKGAAPFLLYLATDTPSMVHRFRNVLNGTMKVVELPQDRPAEGQGVLFGARGDVQSTGRQKCLHGWTDAVMDLILLSYADIVVAARPSSFVQTMPMMLSFGANRHLLGSNKKSYCEVSYNGTKMNCYTDFMDWCCNSIGSFFYGNMNQRYDYIRIPATLETQKWTFLNRSKIWCRPGPGTKTACLPYDWPEQNQFEADQEMSQYNLKR